MLYLDRLGRQVIRDHAPLVFTINQLWVKVPTVCGCCPRVSPGPRKRYTVGTLFFRVWPDDTWHGTTRQDNARRDETRRG